MVRPNPALSGRAGGIKEDYRRKKGPGPPAQMPSQKVQAHPFEAFGMHTVRGEKNHIPLPAKQILANKDSPKDLCGCVWAGQQVYSRVLPPESWSYPLHRHDPSKGKPDGLPGPGFRKRARPCGQRKDHPIPAVVNAEMPFQYSYFRPAVYPDIDYVPISVLFGQAPPFAPIFHYVQHRVQHVQVTYLGWFPLLGEVLRDLFLLFFL